MRIDLPSGAWVELHDPATITNGVRKAAVRAGYAEPTEKLSDLAYLDVLLAALISAWSYEMSVPAGSPSALEALPLDDSNALYREARPWIAKAFPDFSVTPPGTDTPTRP